MQAIELKQPGGRRCRSVSRIGRLLPLLRCNSALGPPWRLALLAHLSEPNVCCHLQCGGSYAVLVGRWTCVAPACRYLRKLGVYLTQLLLDFGGFDTGPWVLARLAAHDLRVHPPKYERPIEQQCGKDDVWGGL